MKRDDALWKSLLEDIFSDFLTFFYPEAIEIFDLDRGFEYLDKELEQLFPPEEDEYNPRFVDKLVKVFSKNGDDQWILVHIEVQGYLDKYFSERMFTYYYRILDKYQKPITAFAILTDGNKNFHPEKYERSFLGTHILYKFNSYKVLDQQEETLLKSNNPFAMVILTVKAAIKSKSLNDEDLLLLKINLAKRLLTKKIPKKKINDLMNFLKYYIRFEKNETNVKFDKELNAITLNKKTMGLEEFLLDRAEKQGMKQGALDKTVSFTKNLLEKKVYSFEEIASLVGESVDFVNKIKAEMK